MFKRAVIAVVFSMVSVSTSFAISEQDQNEIAEWDQQTAEGTEIGSLPELDIANADDDLIDLGIGEMLFKASMKCGTLHITVNESAKPQTLTASCDGNQIFGPVLTSTGKGGSTPNGTYTVYNRIKNATSASYGNAPMARMLVFKSCPPKNGRARPNCVGVHATVKSNYKYLGGMASHGCVRLTMENAVALWDLSHASGVTKVTVK